MESKFVSLLYPDEASLDFHQDRNNLPDITEDVCDELGLNEIFDLKTCSLTDFFTQDERVISYRQRTVQDLLAHPKLLETLSGIHPILDDIRELRRLDNDNVTSADSYLYSITEIELYVTCLDTLRRGFASVGDSISSPAFRGLFNFVKELAESDYYHTLNKKLEALSDRISEVKSITVGVNLDNELRPEFAGVISINSEKFKSGKVLDKILRLSFKNDALTCIAPLTPFGKGRAITSKRLLSEPSTVL